MFSDFVLTRESLAELAQSADELLVHGASLLPPPPSPGAQPHFDWVCWRGRSARALTQHTGSRCASFYGPRAFSFSRADVPRLTRERNQPGVDVEGMKLGIDEELVALLGDISPLPCTYAGGARTLQDLEVVRRAGRNMVDVTIGSALDCFGGDLPYDDVVAWHQSNGR